MLTKGSMYIAVKEGMLYYDDHPDCDDFESNHGDILLIQGPDPGGHKWYMAFVQRRLVYIHIEDLKRCAEELV